MKKYLALSQDIFLPVGFEPEEGSGGLGVLP